MKNKRDHVDVTLEMIYKQGLSNSKKLIEIAGLKDHIKYIWAVIVVILSYLLANNRGIL